MKNSQEEPTPQESTEQQKLPQETTQEQQLPHESTLPNHDLEIIADQSNEGMASNDSFCADTSREGISDRNNGSSTFWDMYSLLDQTYGSKWPTPSEIPILPELGMNLYGSNLPAQLDTPIFSESENPNRGKWVIDSEVKKSHDEVSATDAAAIAAAKAISDAERLLAAVKELEKDRFLIKKTLTKSDVSSKTDGLILPKDSVTENILPFLRADQKALIESGEDLKFNVFDEDEESTFEMRVKNRSDKTYMLAGIWMDKFVKKRGLKEGDTIGLCLVTSYNSIPRLRFTVVAQASIELVSHSICSK